jgi:hypothetical protein
MIDNSVENIANNPCCPVKKSFPCKRESMPERISCL